MYCMFRHRRHIGYRIYRCRSIVKVKELLSVVMNTILHLEWLEFLRYDRSYKIPGVFHNQSGCHRLIGGSDTSNGVEVRHKKDEGL